MKIPQIPSVNKIKSFVIDAVADVAPWLAPSIPAYLVYQNTSDKLGIPFPFNLFAAIAVETLGLASVHTALEFWRWNGEKRKSDNTAPFVVAVAATMFYMVVVLTVNAVLDYTVTLYAQIFAKALLSLLSLDAALIVALRAGHARRMSDIEDDKRERKAERQGARQTDNAPSNDAPNDETDSDKPTGAATIPPFSRGYAGYVEYLTWLSDNGRGWPGKYTVAEEMRVSVRTIERYVAREEELAKL